MMRRLLSIFSVNDPGWGNSPRPNDNKGDAAGSKDGNAGNEGAPPAEEQGASANPPSSKPDTDRKPVGNGPPDLDELWRDFNDRLSNLFGGKKGPSRPSGGWDGKPNPNPNNGRGGPPGGSRPPIFSGGMPFSSKNGILAAVGGVFFIWIASGFFMIQEGQAGVVLTFGKYDYTAGPGINWRMPYPFQTTEVVNISAVRSVEIGRSVVIKATNQKDSSMLTEDENIIDVRFAVQYRLKDPTEYLFNNRDPDFAVVQAAETAVREIVARSTMDNVLYEGREKIAIDLTASIQRILDSYKAGIFITSVTVQNVQPPEQVQAAFDDAVKAGQDQERLKSEGQAYANDIVPRAKGTAARLIEEAEGYKARVIATAEGDAMRFKQILVEYAKAPQVTRDRMYVDTMREVYTNVSKILVDTAKGNNMLYLPLDKIVSQVTAESNQAASQATGSVTVAPAADVPTTRAPERVPDRRDGGLRSRDRDAR
ncbi:MAG: FtsH protease activity modulator HflK [Polynucleobacter sp.]|jgi:membrane protease subunit HflK|uniref:FtsH protease activity modulator HflK n=1 Tax=Polynucleobacter sp. TaxID=2029855 RepID=UPI0027244F01|nr:FtsH protease activity modulator HflK [Polynucleobacter sp.]MDO9014848.1 FtsH protease activity modulator HflK [Polynucleobacter sp.]MDP3122437.1 FtsH protease activity modulator HflK [Polynucleobacter sp.]